MLDRVVRVNVILLRLFGYSHKVWILTSASVSVLSQHKSPKNSGQRSGLGLITGIFGVVPAKLGIYIFVNSSLIDY